jgi:GT2 family glycosyltransferase
MCAGLRDSAVRPALLHIHVNEAQVDSRILGDVLQICAGVADELGLTHSSDNRGFAGAHNDNLAHCFERGMDAVLVLNPDVRLETQTLAQLMAHARDDAPRLLGPLIELADVSTLVPEGRIDSAGIVWTRSGRHLDALQGRPLADAPAAPVDVRGLTGACLLVTRAAHAAVVEACGEFFDRDFIAYREDADLGLRAEALGIEQRLIPEARTLHVRTQRGTRRGTSAFIDCLGVRNRFLIAFKHGHRRPGGLTFAPMRDLTVVAAVLFKERSSLPGLRDAWRLRRSMRAKGQRFRAAARRARP